MNFVPAVAYLFCLNLPAAFSQPGNDLIEIPCRETERHRERGGRPFIATITAAAVKRSRREKNEVETVHKGFADRMTILLF